MNKLFLAARILLALLFVVFGLNGFLNFIPMGPAPTGLAGQFIGSLLQSHYMSVVFVLELGSGILLLLNRYVPLALTLLAPVIANIVLFHVFMAPAGLPLAMIACLLWIATALQTRSAFTGLLQPSIQA